MASGWDINKQQSASAHGMRIEVGVADASYLTDETAGCSASHGIPTNLTSIVGGFCMCISTAGAVGGDPINMGCITTQELADHTFGRGYIDFTMDVTCAGVNNWLVFGY